MLQCVAVRCSVLQCVVRCSRALPRGLSHTHTAMCCSVLQCGAVCCSVLQCVAACCSKMQQTLHTPVLQRVTLCVAVRCSVLRFYFCPSLLRALSLSLSPAFHLFIFLARSLSPDESLQHTATHCNTLQHTTTHCNTLQHTATHCNTLQHTSLA